MCWLHNPSCIWLSSKFFNKNVVITREKVSKRDYIHLNISTKLIFFGERRVLTIEIFAVSLDVLNHKILFAKLIRVGEVVKYLIVWKTEARIRIENFTFHSPRKCPVHIPLVFSCRPCPASSFKISDEYSFFKISPKF